MMSTQSPRRAGVPVVHPGPIHPERITSVPSRVEVVRGELPAGKRLTDALWDLMGPTGARAAAVEFGPGTFGNIPYVFPAIGPAESKPVTFTEVHRSRGPNVVLGGSATVGLRFGERFTHTHASWMDATGTIRGGHLMPEATVGEVPILVVMRALMDAEQLSTDCAETELPAFAPQARPFPGELRETCPRAVISRVRPGVLLDEAVVEVCRRAGFREAVVRASLGSTVGALIDQGEGNLVEVDWPAVEFTQLVGAVHDADGPEPAVELQGSLVDLHGVVHHGVVRNGLNPVAVTFELYVEEVADGRADA